MRCGWTKVALGEVFDVDLDPVPVDASATYGMVGVLSYGRGLFQRPEQSGADTSYRTFYRLREGQIVLSQLFGWEGAIAPVTAAFAGRFVSSQFPTFRPKPHAEPAFMRWLIRNPDLWSQLRQSAKGMGDRRRTLSPEIFFSAKSVLPPRAEQQRIAAHLDAIETRLNRVQQLRDEAVTKREALMTSLHLALAKDRSVRLDHLLRLSEESCAVVPSGSYPQVGIRSFGLGLFKKSPVSGTGTTYRSFNVLRPGMFIMSQVKGWEGAVGVCSDEFDGWFVSPEYRTFACQDGECDPSYLSFLVRTPWFREQLASATRGVGARRERVRPEMLLALEMPFPAIEKQREAVKALRQLRVTHELSARSDAAHTALLPSLLDQVFNP